MTRHAKASSAGSTQEKVSHGVPVFQRLAFSAATGIVAIVLLAWFVAPASAATHLPLEVFGTAAQPTFGSAAGLAVDQSTGDVLIMDASAGTVSRYHADGTPADFPALGTNVIDGQGPGDATPENGLSFSGPNESQIAVDNSGRITDGDIYVTQSSPKLINIFSDQGEYLGQLTGYGSPSSSFVEACGVAVDPTGAVYVGDYFEGVRKFVPTANPPVDTDVVATLPVGRQTPCTVAAGAAGSAGSLFIAEWNGSTYQIDSSTGAIKNTVFAGTSTTVSVDPSDGHAYVANGTSIKEFNTAAVPRLVSDTSAESEVRGLAIDGGSRSLYLSRSGASTLEVSPVGPLAPGVSGERTAAIDPTDAEVQAEINPEGSATTYHLEYGTDATYGSSTAESGVGSDKVDHTVGTALTGLEIGTLYHWRVVATNSIGTSNGPDQTFTTDGLPTSDLESVSDVTSDEAVLHARVDPQGAVTKYRFEYGLDTSYGQSTGEITLASDESSLEVAGTLEGLQAGTSYHWRVVATNTAGTHLGPDNTFHTPGLPVTNSTCPNQAFRTGSGARLPDCRAYEMVTPVEKNNTDISVPINLQSQLVRLNQASIEGGKLTYTASAGFGDTVGHPYTSQYIASRGADGWSNHSITPPQGVSPTEGGLRIDLEFRAFTADLCAAAMRHTTSELLAPGAVEGYFNIYRRQNCGEGGYEAVTISTPPNEPNGSYTPTIQGFSADGRCTVFRVEDQLTPDANPAVGSATQTNMQLYESCGGPLRLVSMLPNGNANQQGSSVGTANDSGNQRTDTDAGAVSSDGSRIYWTASIASGPLYLRENAEQGQSTVSGGECTEADKACTIVVSNSPYAHFWSASPDDSKALFTEGRLTEDGVTLYEFSLSNKSSAPIASDVVGVMGASEDASRIAFASEEVLTAGANTQGKSPAAGEPNLYLYDSTKSGSDRFRFIGVLSEVDAGFFGSQGGSGGSYLGPLRARPSEKTSRLSPDGRHIAFTSNASLTGYNNIDADTGEADAEVFSYDVAANGGEGMLRCVSCNPTGQRPVGRDPVVESYVTKPRFAALLQPWVTELYGSHVISDDGSRIFFDSYDALVSSDSNGRADVYEWEAPGAGDCTESTPAYSPLNEGCISLFSSGESPADSEFVDASPDGRDVFFLTGSSLLPQDTGLIDIYDAREGGGYPSPPGLPASCEGEACQGPLAPPNDPTPASSAFEGAGNVKAAKKKARHKKKAHRKKKSSKTKSKQRSHRANDNRRAAR